MTEHEQVADLLAAWALGAVHTTEARLVEGHLVGCDECRAEARLMQDGASRVVGEAADLPDSLWARIAACAQLDPDRARGNAPLPGSSLDKRLADDFQRALVPAPLPAIDGWAVATGYEAAGDELLVGGDFYDAFALPGAALAIVLGDVSGSGPEAGLLGVSIRRAVRTALWCGLDLAEALTRVEESLAHELAGRWARLTLATVEPNSARAQVVCAGTPAPLVIKPAGSAVLSPPANAALGSPWRDRWHVLAFDVERGEMLVLLSNSAFERVSAEAQLSNGMLGGHSFLPSDPRPHDTVLRLLAKCRDGTDELKDDLVVAALRRL